MAKSRQKTRDQILGVLSARRAEGFLCNLANLQDSEDLQPIPAPVERLVAHYPEMFAGDRDPTETAAVLRQLLRLAWDAPDLRHRDWYCHQMETYYHQLRPDRDLKDSLGPQMAKAVLRADLEPGSWQFSVRQPPAIPLPLEVVLFYFKRKATQLRHCPNPECPAPYFFSHKKGQKHCSGECAKVAQRAAKLRWWHENRGK